MSMKPLLVAVVQLALETMALALGQIVELLQDVLHENRLRGEAGRQQLGAWGNEETADFDSDGEVRLRSGGWIGVSLRGKHCVHIYTCCYAHMTFLYTAVRHV